MSDPVAAERPTGMNAQQRAREIIQQRAPGVLGIQPGLLGPAKVYRSGGEWVATIQPVNGDLTRYTGLTPLQAALSLLAGVDDDLEAEVAVEQARRLSIDVPNVFEY